MEASICSPGFSSVLRITLIDLSGCFAPTPRYNLLSGDGLTCQEVMNEELKIFGKHCIDRRVEVANDTVLCKSATHVT